MSLNWTFIWPFEKAQVVLVAITIFTSQLFDESDNWLDGQLCQNCFALYGCCVNDRIIRIREECH